MGHRHQPTAISVTERAYVPTGETFNIAHRDGMNSRLEAREQVTLEYRVRHLERLGPPSRYRKAAERVSEIVLEMSPQDVAVVVDITATGRPAFSLIRQEINLACKDTRVRPKFGIVTVSGVAGGVSKSPDAGHLVPRRDLISAAQILLDDGRLKIAEALSLAGTLRDELLAFKPKPDKPDDLEGWRERPHDDLVLAVAVSTWAAQRFLRKEKSVPVGALGAA